MTNLERTLVVWSETEYPAEVVPAPEGAVTFDKMLVVWLDGTKRKIRQVSLYDSKIDRFVGVF